MITRREFCVELAATVAVASPLSLAAVPTAGLKPMIKCRGGKSREFAQYERFIPKDFSVRDNPSFISRMHELKARYLDMLQDEGCLNEILFDRPDLDESDGHDIDDYGAERLIAMVPDDVIFDHCGNEVYYDPYEDDSEA